MSGLAARIASLFRTLGGRAGRERELDEELEAYVSLSEARHRERGLSPAAARRAALQELGGVDQVKEKVRDAWAGATVDGWWRDLRHGLRSLRRNPGFAVAAILTLALGIGANTAIFSVIHAVLLRPLPYDDPDRLALVWFRFDGAGQSRNPASGPELLDLRERSRRFDAFAAVWSTSGALTGDGDPEQVRVGLVTANFFQVLGARPAVGRAFLSWEEGQEAPGAILLSDGLWRRRYAADPAILGRTILFNGQAVTVVGVLPPAFEIRFPAGSSVPREIQAWLPCNWDNRTMPRDLSFLRVLGRMSPGVTVAQAREEMDSIATGLRGEFARYQEMGLGLDVVPLHEDVVREVRPALLALFGGVGLVLLIACVNVANLQLSRFGVRRKEIAVRAALGAGRWRVFRQLLVESLALALIGGAVGVLLGALGLELLVRLRPRGFADLADAQLSLPVLLFTLALAIGTGVVFGLVPFLESSRVQLTEALGRGGRSGSAPLRERARDLLVAAEVAFGFLLLIGAGLTIQTLARTLDADPGFRPQGVLTFQVSLPRARYPDDAARAALARGLRESVAGLPGVVAVGATSHLPLDDAPNWYGFVWQDGATEQERNSLLADQRSVTPGYFAAMGADLVQGRAFDATDDADTRQVVIVDEVLARQLWPGESPLGRGLHLEAYVNGEFIPRRVEVVGVVHHLRHHALTSEPRGQAYLPHAQSARPVLSFAVRSSTGAAALARPVAARLAAMDPELPMARAHAMTDYVREASATARFTAALSGIFAAAALLLASVGIYGVLAYGVTQRTREIGMRLVLGAGTGQILRLVIGRGFRATVAGLAVGVLGAVLLSRFLAGLLYGVTATDPWTYGAVAALLLTVALAASWLPARRAARVDPMVSLRSE